MVRYGCGCEYDDKRSTISLHEGDCLECCKKRLTMMHKEIKAQQDKNKAEEAAVQGEARATAIDTVYVVAAKAWKNWGKQ